jgi:5-(carboxyamino)imidazole ribonucleotide mutase
MFKQKVVLLLGSKSDLKFASSITDTLQEYCVDFDVKIASAHRTPEHLLKILKRYEKAEDAIIYVTVAGLSDALSGVVSGFTRFPVIACPPDTEKHGWPKVFSSTITPKGIAVCFIANPENAALAAVKIFALSNPKLHEEILYHKKKRQEKIIKAEEEDSQIKEKHVGEKK